ncbi:MAG: PilZ protein [Pseudomonadota bacterium]|nr:PilZ protein [Pseudomonadota bacterium]
MIRKDYRLAIGNAWVQLQRMHAEDRSAVDGTRYPVYNISRGGLRFSGNETFEAQERIKVILHLPNNTEHHSLGRICYCEPDTENQAVTYYGVSFLDNFLDMAPFQDAPTLP